MTKKEELKIFEAAETRGRDRAIKAISKVKFSDVEYNVVPTVGACRWDYELRDKATNKLIGIIETKNRNIAPDDPRIVKEGLQLEKKKYDALKEKSMIDHVKAYLMATMMDNYFMMWDLDTCPVTFGVRNCPRSTAIDRGRIDIECAYFKVCDTFAKGKLE